MKEEFGTDYLISRASWTLQGVSWPQDWQVKTDLPMEDAGIHLARSVSVTQVLAEPSWSLDRIWPRF